MGTKCATAVMSNIVSTEHHSRPSPCGETAVVRYNVILSRENLTSAQYISTMAMHAVSCACDHQEVVYVFVISVVPVWVGPVAGVLAQWLEAHRR